MSMAARIRITLYCGGTRHARRQGGHPVVLECHTTVAMKTIKRRGSIMACARRD
jgi:hypothetical protein